MSEKTDADLTLPSVMAALPARYREEVLVLTLVFHPDPRRIGETAVLPRRGPWTLGRLSPDFGAAPDSGGPLGDQHVSREAVRLSWQGGCLHVRRFTRSSRCRVGGRELESEAVLERAVLREGVPLLLGHGVVLLLRMGAPPQAAVTAQPGYALLKGRSAYMCSLREQIASVGEIDVDVLVRGETGTGKELVATAIHRASRRSDAPLVCVNMSAIPPGLAPAALFGNLKGSFTGAERSGRGYFREAEGGSLFLDEIGDTPPEIQPQLLRALQQREIQPVGAPVRRVDVRVISATDAALEGPGCDFKAALRHRLGACEIVLRPLREHPEDIGELLWHFLRLAAAGSGGGPALPGEGSSDLEIAAWAELFHHFLCFHWPGNVRQLANFAQQVMLTGGSLPVLPDSVASALETPAGAAPKEETTGSVRRMQEIGDREFDEAMQACRYEAAPVARALGVSRPSVYRRIEETPGLRLAAQVPEEELQQVLDEHDGDLQATAMALRVSASGLRARLRHSGR
jgi:two-component system nitrogen regulation response regulator GlnG